MPTPRRGWTATSRRDVTDWAGVEAYYAGSDEEFKGWLRVAWARPSGAALEAVETKLKALKLTIRNAPADQPAAFAACVFTGAPGVRGNSDRTRLLVPGRLEIVQDRRARIERHARRPGRAGIVAGAVPAALGGDHHVTRIAVTK